METIEELRERAERAELEAKIAQTKQPEQEKKSPMATLLLLLFFGLLGIHRAYLGRWGLFLLYFITCAGGGLFCFFDLIKLLTVGLHDRYNNVCKF